MKKKSQRKSPAALSRFCVEVTMSKTYRIYQYADNEGQAIQLAQAARARRGLRRSEAHAADETWQAIPPAFKR